jgi:hypothetical protein
MVTWKEFAAAEPDLADVGRSLLFQFKVGLAFLATVRKDGAPRLHPVCPVLSTDHLFVLIIPTSPKRHDLLRDGRYALRPFPSRSLGVMSSTSRAKPWALTIRPYVPRSFETPSTWPTHLKLPSSSGSITLCTRGGRTC